MNEELLGDEFADWLWENHKVDLGDISNKEANEYYDIYLEAYPEPDAIDEYKKEYYG